MMDILDKIFKAATLNMFKNTKGHQLRRSKRKSMVIMSQQIQTINEKLEVIFKKKKSKRDLNGMEIVKMKSIIKKLKFYYKAHQKI